MKLRWSVYSAVRQWAALGRSNMAKEQVPANAAFERATIAGLAGWKTA